MYLEVVLEYLSMKSLCLHPNQKSLCPHPNQSCLPDQSIATGSTPIDCGIVLFRGRPIRTTAMSDTSLTQMVKNEARRKGFQLVGVCPAVEPSGLEHFRSWLQSGYAGEMRYLPDRSEAYTHPDHVLDGCRSLIMLGMNYSNVSPSPTATGQGRISRYAWGPADYHDHIRERLNELAEFLQQREPLAVVRGVVDTAPLLEREFAQLAGLGWIGKNTLLIDRQQGSWFFLAALLTNLQLEYDSPHTANHCGTCRACLDACPTDAFPEPYVLDATRCISYLNIELRQPIPVGLRAGMGDWLFGCDICQDVCPWNRGAPAAEESWCQPAPDNNPCDLADLFALDDDTFRARFRHTPLWRSKRRGVLRNAAIVLGNQGDPRGLAPLILGLNDDEPLVRGASAWALGRLGEEQAGNALQQRLAAEQDATVRDEIKRALDAPTE